MQDFIHLHVHTYYSILDGQSSVSKLVDKAVANGMKGMAITDHGDMFGVKELFNYCNKVNGKLRDAGQPEFKPIFGSEMYVAKPISRAFLIVPNPVTITFVDENGEELSFEFLDCIE